MTFNRKERENKSSDIPVELPGKKTKSKIKGTIRVPISSELVKQITGYQYNGYLCTFKKTNKRIRKHCTNNSVCRESTGFFIRRCKRDHIIVLAYVI